MLIRWGNNNSSNKWFLILELKQSAFIKCATVPSVGSCTAVRLLRLREITLRVRKILLSQSFSSFGGPREKRENRIAIYHSKETSHAVWHKKMHTPPSSLTKTTAHEFCRWTQLSFPHTAVQFPYSIPLLWNVLGSLVPQIYQRASIMCTSNLLSYILDKKRLLHLVSTFSRQECLEVTA